MPRIVGTGPRSPWSTLYLPGGMLDPSISPRNSSQLRVNNKKRELDEQVSISSKPSNIVTTSKLA
jgi:hypothetical protein